MVDFRSALAQQLLAQGAAGGNTVGSGLNALGASLGGALLARRAQQVEDERIAATNAAFDPIISALTGAPTVATGPGAPLSLAGPGQAFPGAEPAQVASAGGGGFSTGGVMDRNAILGMMLSNPDLLRDPRAAAILPMLAQPETDVVSPEREAQLIRLADARRQPAATINVGPQGQQFGSPPSGMVWARNQDGSIAVQPTTTPDGIETFAPVAVPISGGPVEAERAAAAVEAAAGEEQAAMAEERERATAETLVSDIDRIGQLIQGAILPTTGLAGGVLANVGGTAARDIRGLLDTIRANIGFEALSQMRQASPTGGALGQITERELQRLEAVMGNLEQSQSEEQFLRNLDRVRQEFNSVIHGSPQGSATQETTVTTPEGTVTQTETVQEGATATNPNTGERIIFRNGQWVPLNG